jgi:hypothetical protein
MISYLSAKVVPRVSSSFGVSIVLVTLMSSEEGTGEAHSLQNLESEGLSVWHFGHLFDIAGFLFSHAWSEKEYQGKRF